MQFTKNYTDAMWSSCGYLGGGKLKHKNINDSFSLEEGSYT